MSTGIVTNFAKVHEMKFAKIVFWVASIWGILVLTPLYFMFDLIGRQDPPLITHPAFYYGFAGTALVWQFAFMVIARDPGRFRSMMIPAVLEKFGYGGTLLVLFAQHRLHASDLVLGAVDTLLGILFLIAFFRTAP
jgi:vacuolar-type H+-ATPase subunit I/STV1